MVPIYAVLIFFPRAKLTQRIVDSPLLPALLGTAYAVLAWQAGQAGLLQQLVDTVAASFPAVDLPALACLFQHHTLTCMAWLHLLLLDFWMARGVLLDGLVQLVPTGHSIALCFMFGPLGLLSHILTKSLLGKGGSQRAAGGLV